MSPEDKLAVEECLVLWKYLAQSGISSKQTAIIKLYKQGKLHTDYYLADCPLCDSFDCDKCPWQTVPNADGVYTVCMKSGSHYLLWLHYKYLSSRVDRQKAASAVYKFLKQIKV